MHQSTCCVGNGTGGGVGWGGSTAQSCPKSCAFNLAPLRHPAQHYTIDGVKSDGAERQKSMALCGYEFAQPTLGELKLLRGQFPNACSHSYLPPPSTRDARCRLTEHGHSLAHRFEAPFPASSSKSSARKKVVWSSNSEEVLQS